MLISVHLLLVDNREVKLASNAPPKKLTKLAILKNIIEDDNESKFSVSQQQVEGFNVPRIRQANELPDDYSTNAVKAAVLERYPQRDYVDCKLDADSLPDFCFPMGPKIIAVDSRMITNGEKIVYKNPNS